MSFTSSVETREAGSGVVFAPESVSKAAAEVRKERVLVVVVRS
jgi:hypothetical protein